MPKSLIHNRTFLVYTHIALMPNISNKRVQNIVPSRAFCRRAVTQNVAIRCISSKWPRINDLTKDGGKELFAKMH